MTPNGTETHRERVERMLREAGFADWTHTPRTNQADAVFGLRNGVDIQYGRIDGEDYVALNVHHQVEPVIGYLSKRLSDYWGSEIDEILPSRLAELRTERILGVMAYHSTERDAIAELAERMREQGHEPAVLVNEGARSPNQHGVIAVGERVIRVEYAGFNFVATVTDRDGTAIGTYREGHDIGGDLSKMTRGWQPTRLDLETPLGTFGVKIVGLHRAYIHGTATIGGTQYPIGFAVERKDGEWIQPAHVVGPPNFNGAGLPLLSREQQDAVVPSLIEAFTPLARAHRDLFVRAELSRSLEHASNIAFVQAVTRGDIGLEAYYAQREVAVGRNVSYALWLREHPEVELLGPSQERDDHARMQGERDAALSRLVAETRPASDLDRTPDERSLDI